MRLAPALLAAVSAAAWAQPRAARDFTWDLSAGVQHRRLVERADDGSRLVEESGPMLRLALDGQLALANGGALRAGLGLARGALDYDGRTQGGTPLATDSTHTDADLGLAWRPLAASRWGEGWLVLRAVRQRRDIASTRAAAGLTETSTLWLPGLRWSHAFDAAGWRWQPSAEFRVSARHRLAVDFGGIYDDVTLGGGRRRELALGLQVSAPASPWRAGFQWTHARQSASASATLLRGGAAVGTVRQPRIAIDDVALELHRAF